MGSPELLLEIIKIMTQSTVLARAQQIGSVSNQFSLFLENRKLFKLNEQMLGIKTGGQV